MSSFDVGKAKAVIDHEVTELRVGIGRGWGGDGKHVCYSYLEYDDKDNNLHMILLTNNYLRHLINVMENALSAAEEMERDDKAMKANRGSLR